jgi:hypothetical protein
MMMGVGVAVGVTVERVALGGTVPTQANIMKARSANAVSEAATARPLPPPALSNRVNTPSPFAYAD